MLTNSKSIELLPCFFSKYPIIRLLMKVPMKRAVPGFRLKKERLLQNLEKILERLIEYSPKDEPSATRRGSDNADGSRLWTRPSVPFIFIVSAKVARVTFKHRFPLQNLRNACVTPNMVHEKHCEN